MKAAGTVRADKTNHFDGIAWENRAKSPIFSILLQGLAILWRIFGIYAMWNAFFLQSGKDIFVSISWGKNGVVGPF